VPAELSWVQPGRPDVLLADISQGMAREAPGPDMATSMNLAEQNAVLDGGGS
jgi:hypothetical protein